MIKRIIGILVAIASLAVLSLVVLNHRSITTLIPHQTTSASAPAEPTPAPEPPVQIDSLTLEPADTLRK